MLNVPPGRRQLAAYATLRSTAMFRAPTGKWAEYLLGRICRHRLQNLWVGKVETAHAKVGNGQVFQMASWTMSWLATQNAFPVAGARHPKRSSALYPSPCFLIRGRQVISPLRQDGERPETSGGGPRLVAGCKCRLTNSRRSHAFRRHLPVLALGLMRGLEASAPRKCAGSAFAANFSLGLMRYQART